MSISPPTIDPRSQGPLPGSLFMQVKHFDASDLLGLTCELRMDLSEFKEVFRPYDPINPPALSQFQSIIRVIRSQVEEYQGRTIDFVYFKSQGQK